VRVAPQINLGVEDVLAVVEDDHILAERLARPVQRGVEVGTHALRRTIGPEIEADVLAALPTVKQQVVEHLAGRVRTPFGQSNRLAVTLQPLVAQRDHAQAVGGVRLDAAQAQSMAHAHLRRAVLLERAHQFTELARALHHQRFQRRRVGDLRDQDLQRADSLRFLEAKLHDFLGSGQVRTVHCCRGQQRVGPYQFGARALLAQLGDQRFELFAGSGSLSQRDARRPQRGLGRHPFQRQFVLLGQLQRLFGQRLGFVRFARPALERGAAHQDGAAQPGVAETDQLQRAVV